MTIRKIKKKLKVLQEILNKRLSYSKKWRKVDIWHDNDYIYIHWNGKKRDFFFNEFHEKQIPVKDIDKVIARNRAKLHLKY